MQKLLYLAALFAMLLSDAIHASEIVFVELISDRDYVSSYSAEELVEVRASLDAYAAKSKLEVLREGGPDEIRFWISWATFDPDTIGYDTEGYVISNQGSWLCHVTYPRKEHSPASGSCKPNARSSNAKTILSRLGSLSKLSGKSLGCGVMDGEWMSVDGVFAGKRFTFSSGNPGSCSDEGSKLIAKALKDVR